MTVHDYPQSTLIRGIRWLSEPLLYPDSHGDVWSCAWADDDRIYSVADDTHGIGDACNSNMALHSIDGMPPEHRALTINPMSEYGKLGEREGSDTWKANGLTCIDGVLYLSVSQHSSASDYPDNIQRVYDATIVKSEDHGATWSAKRAVGQPMFPGPRFATPFFVQYGKDYAGAFDDYVYAVSNVASWNNGNAMAMGRVRRDRIAQLDSSDWDFLVELDAEQQPVWNNRYTNRFAGMFQQRGRSSMTGIQYVPAVDRFLLAQWAYTNLDGPRPWRHTALALYEAPRPWGPWHHVYTEPDWGYAYYNPSLPAKWFEDGGVRMWMTMAGNFSQEHDAPFSYGLIVRRLELLV